VLLQNHIRKQDGLRWVMHMLMFVGFTFLLFTHALGNIIKTSLFDKYYLTLNPYLLVSGGMVLAGVLIAIGRRIALKVRGLKTNAMDGYLLILLAVILLSGMAMESTKLTSYVYYQKFWDIHFLTCLLGLAYLPFSKLFHILTTPLSLLARAVMDENSDPVNIHTRRVLALDACMHCGSCSRRCSVAAAYDHLGNEEILPAERMIFLKEYIAYKEIDAQGLAAIQQGIYLCTNCDRCTVSCPAGIDLRDLWFNVREEVIHRGHGVPLMLTPFSFYRGLNRQKLDPEQYDQPLQEARKEVRAPFGLDTDAVIPLTAANREFAKAMSGRIDTFSFCFACENCSTVCPVVGTYENPQQRLDMLPHQIIRAVSLGQRELAMGARMLWYCLTCYQCQEHCPQGVKVTDIFYELKNMAVMEADRASARTGSAERADR
jgi:heterodisulfide reductase subunit C